MILDAEIFLDRVHGPQSMASDLTETHDVGPSALPRPTSAVVSRYTHSAPGEHPNSLLQRIVSSRNLRRP